MYYICLHEQGTDKSSMILTCKRQTEGRE